MRLPEAGLRDSWRLAEAGCGPAKSKALHAIGSKSRSLPVAMNRRVPLDHGILVVQGFVSDLKDFIFDSDLAPLFGQDHENVLSGRTQAPEVLSPNRCLALPCSSRPQKSLPPQPILTPRGQVPNVVGPTICPCLGGALRLQSHAATHPVTSAPSSLGSSHPSATASLPRLASPSEKRSPAYSRRQAPRSLSPSIVHGASDPNKARD